MFLGDVFAVRLGGLEHVFAFDVGTTRVFFNSQEHKLGLIDSLLLKGVLLPLCTFVSVVLIANTKASIIQHLL